MVKIASLTTLTTNFSSVQALNANFTKIVTALENTVSRDGSTPNTMSADFDVNSNKLINLANATNNQDAVPLQQLQTLLNAVMLNWRGAWVTATAYLADDAVSNGGSSYVATSNHTSAADTEPGTGANWMNVWDLVAAKGDTGATGATGAQGPGNSVEDDDVQVVATASTLNFTGAGVVVTDGGSGQANVAIAGGGSFVGAMVKFDSDTGSLSSTQNPVEGWESADYDIGLNGNSFWLGPDLNFTADNTTNRLTATSHGMVTGDGPIRVTNSGGTLPTGLTADTNYWVIRIDDNTIQLASTFANAGTSTAVAFTTDGTGTQTLDRASRLVIPGDGATHYIQLHTVLRPASGVFSSQMSLRFRKNGADTAFIGNGLANYSNAFNTSMAATESGVLKVAGGDFFEVRFTNSDVSYTFGADSCSFSIHFIQ